MEFIDLAAQQKAILGKLEKRISSVMKKGAYIMGPEVTELEGLLAEFCGAKRCISCANGTDALILAMMALGVGSGDAVIVPSFTFASTAEAPCVVGAKPIFAEVDPATFNICPESVERCLSEAQKHGLKVKALIPVDLFGLPANYEILESLCQRENLKLVADSAQGWGGTSNGRMTGTFGDITTTSFFPAKPLGCYGDGGALFTDNVDTAMVLDSLRVHGKGQEKYDNIRVGLNSRLDTLQAAILIEKLAIYPSELIARQKIADYYTEALHEKFITPQVPSGSSSIWAQYTIQAKNQIERDAAMKKLASNGIPSGVYYPKPLHTQSAYSSFLRDPNGLVTSENLSRTVFSLPMHPYLTRADQDRVIGSLLGQS